MLHQGMTVTEVARILCAARASVERWINLFTLYGVSELKSLKPGREPQWLVADILRILPLLVQRSPQDFGWLRSRWSTELLALVVNRLFDISLHPVTLHRYLRLSLHEAVTRNHQCRYMWQLLNRVTQFMKAASPFPGN
ncbi:hypothetical protein PEC302110_26770 [Pectobacterium araliae]|uniref:Uncharacterized protein n=1 Tax=Pectobacterium araliae TaxID=3073862 RepID=A0AAN0KBQ2_9GAMM|nr:hypothetical protein PEC302110_26770 [Pectobacterium sp. MAFF 302110]